jgi:hypothetical protein
MIKRSLVMASLVLAGVSAADPKTDREQAIEQAKKTGILGPPGIPEVVELGKTMSGTWTCDGNLFAPDKKAIPISGHMTMAVELNRVWLHESLDAGVGQGSSAMNYKFEAFITFDKATKKWRRVEVDSLGGHTISSADPAKDGKLEWLNESTGADGKVQQQRTHFDGSDPKQVHVVGEITLDKGKTWIKTADLSCKK